MKLRKLKIKDAKLMLEWMHDAELVKDMRSGFLSKTIDDCKSFIIESNKKTNGVHFAIADDDDKYMGTVSLKCLDYKHKSAEFGISIRRSAMGRGFSWYGMQCILKYAFESIDLLNVYWCVSKRNIRALRFYEKHGFVVCNDVPTWMAKNYEDKSDLIWFLVRKSDYDFNKNRNRILDCKIMNIRTIDSPESGMLSFFESGSSLPFQIKRFYYISCVKEGIKRGFHAHKRLKQLLFCPYGEIIIILDNGKQREELLLNSPSVGIIIEKPIWREMIWVKTNSVLCVAASDYYSENDYIRNYDEFKEYLTKNTFD